MKSEPDEVSIDDVMASPNRTTAWFGAQLSGAYLCVMPCATAMVCCSTTGVARSRALPVWPASSASPIDASQFDRASPYYDPKATPEQPRWISIDVQGTHKTRLLPLAELRNIPELAEMVLLQKGSRL
jgi:predicted RNA-binding protein with PUA-like domain